MFFLNSIYIFVFIKEVLGILIFILKNLEMYNKINWIENLFNNDFFGIIVVYDKCYICVIF